MMENTTNKARRNKTKQDWNDAHYTQVKISVDPLVASSFKKACMDSDISMAKAISQFMSSYSQGNSKTKNIVPSKDFSTRKRRRNMLKALLQDLELIKAAEEAYRDNIPTNLQSSSVYENAEQTVAALEEAIEILAVAFE